jgi:rSAM/selenodomain-associated transferase 2
MSTSQLATISVIIPVLNEAENLPKTLTAIPTAPNLEVIVVDGGSQDDTVSITRRFGAQVIVSKPGRAYQMNVGAIAAQGEILLFLHGDTRLPADFVWQVHQTLAQPGVAAGAFELTIDAGVTGLRWVEWGVRWRSRLLQLPYGDQAIFLKARVFHGIGGFPELPIMEDFELLRRLKRQGRIAIAPTAVITSGRRWQKLGVLKTTLLNQLAIVAYLLGVSPTRIARWHRKQ